MFVSKPLPFLKEITLLDLKRVTMLIKRGIFGGALKESITYRELFCNVSNIQLNTHHYCYPCSSFLIHDYRMRIKKKIISNRSHPHHHAYKRVNNTNPPDHLVDSLLASPVFPVEQPAYLSLGLLPSERCWCGRMPTKSEELTQKYRRASHTSSL